MKRRIRRWITGIMTASILSQFLGGTVSMAADRGTESVSSDSAFVLEDTISDGEATPTESEAANASSASSANLDSSEQGRNSVTDDDAVSSNAGRDTVITFTEGSSDQSNTEGYYNGHSSDEDSESDNGDVSAEEDNETVSGDNAEDFDQADNEKADDRVDGCRDDSAERGVLETELSAEPYVFNYDSFSVEWRVVSHWEGACNVSVSLRNKSDVTIHN